MIDQCAARQRLAVAKEKGDPNATQTKLNSNFPPHRPNLNLEVWDRRRERDAVRLFSRRLGRRGRRVGLDHPRIVRGDVAARALLVVRGVELLAREEELDRRVSVRCGFGWLFRREAGAG